MASAKSFFSLLVLAALLASCGESKPPLPIEMKYRPAFFGGSYVWMFQNQSDKELRIWVTFSRGWRTLRKGELTLPPRGERTIGWLEGVTLQQGDSLKAENPAYITYEGSVPRTFD